MKGALYTLNLHFQDNFINQMLLYCCDEAASQRLLVPSHFVQQVLGEPEAEVRALHSAPPPSHHCGVWVICPLPPQVFSC